jgi:hypothetical protein
LIEGEVGAGTAMWALLKASAVSMLVHACLLVGLGLVVLAQPPVEQRAELIATGELAEPPPEATATLIPTSRESLVSADSAPVAETKPAPALAPSDLPRLKPVTLASLSTRRLNPAQTLTGAGVNLLGEVPEMGVAGGGVPQLAVIRSPEARKESVYTRGGTPASEAAVDLALDWLAHHQHYDGSWSFDHRMCGDCRGQCGNPGSLSEVRIGATGLAVLPFLGAGYTHSRDKYGQDRKYRRTIDMALRYITSHMQNVPLDGSLTQPGGRMYDHGIATIALCEAYGMTQDRKLYRPAMQAIHFMVAAQDPEGGGWRYQPHQAGDMSVVAWYLMALKSAHLAYLPVPYQTVQRASHFLDSVQQRDGAGYGYTSSAFGSNATSAAGLLCRMLLGWKREMPSLHAGISTLSSLGPSNDDMYYNYYATQVMHHFDGPLWKRWNDQMRDYLVNSQGTQGHERGSWYFEDPHGAHTGGRLYSTAMAAMTLEVYYRHMPIYDKRATNDDFGRPR